MLLMGVAAALVVSIGLELGYRYVQLRSVHLPPAKWLPDAELIYRLNPDNPETPGSFRGKAPTVARSAPVRIICMGGSTTYGTGVEANEAWPKVAEDALLAQGLRVEVINAGAEGYGSRHLLLRYRREIAALHADFVVVYEGWNHTGALIHPTEWVPEAVGRPGMGWSHRLGIAVARHSLLLQRVAEIVVPWLKRPSAGTGETTPGLAAVGDRDHEVWVVDMTTLVREIIANGQRPVLIRYPALYHADMQPEELALYQRKIPRTVDAVALAEFARKRAAIERIAEETGASMIAVDDALRDVRGEARAALFCDGSHATAAGHHRIGEVIAAALAKLIRGGG